MKSSDLWKKLPTAAELLENPRVRSVVDRLNPSVVTAQVRTFLDDVRADLAHRAEEANLPSFSELADRVSRYLSGADAYQVGGAINASGRFRGGPWVSTPLAEAAVERMLLTAQDFTLSQQEGRADEDARRLLVELTGAEAAALFTSHAAALQQAMETLTTDSRLVIARGEVGTVERNCRVTDLSMAAGVTLLEVGAADSVHLSDYEQALAGGPATVLRMGSSTGADAACRPTLEALIQAVKAQGGVAVVELGAAPVQSIAGLATLLPSVQEAIGWGASLVLVRGDGLVGGPACGAAAGDAAVIERLLDSPLTATRRVDACRAAALAATLRLHSDAERAALSIPTLTLVTAPIDNLKSRAERLAPQLAVSPRLAAAEAVELRPAPVCGLPVSAPSWGVRLRPQQGDATQLADQLLSGSPAVAGRIEADCVVLDLRTVFPRQDLDLVALFEPADPAGSSDDPAPPPVD
ncbi:hypothetical protein [Posidoniimonas corsicana]|nr:hypothetical protein [Posidoniimonas corsicana]